MKILVTGGCGYVGTPLTEALLQDGHQVTVVDAGWFGDYLTPHPDLVVIKADIRDAKPEWFAGKEAVLHLANIAHRVGNKKLWLDTEKERFKSNKAANKLLGREYRKGFEPVV